MRETGGGGLCVSVFGKRNQPPRDKLEQFWVSYNTIYFHKVRYFARSNAAVLDSPQG